MESSREDDSLFLILSFSLLTVRSLVGRGVAGPLVAGSRVCRWRLVGAVAASQSVCLAWRGPSDQPQGLDGE